MSASDFLGLLYGEEAPGWLCVTTIDPNEPDPDKRTRPTWFVASEHSKAAAYAERQSERANVYFGLGLHAARPKRGRGAAAGVSALPGFWFDFDVRGPAHRKGSLPESAEEVCELLDTLPLPPTLLVESGNGLHAYWLFREPWTLDNADERAEAARLSSGWQSFILAQGAARGWPDLDNTADLARILRLPGTLNHKSNPPRPVRVVHHDAECRYNPDDFEAFAPVQDPAPEVLPAVEADATPTEGQDGIIGAFNAAHTDIGAILEAHGYMRAGSRWIAPESESGTPGVVALVGKDGRTRVFSHHGSDPLNTGKALDAFDLYTIFEHAGDRDAALRAFAAERAEEGESAPDLTHDALALELGELWRGRARYVAAWARWYFYNGRVWREDASLWHMTGARKFLRKKAARLKRWAEKKLKAAQESNEVDKLKEAEKAADWAASKAAQLCMAPNVAAVIGLAQSNPHQAATVEQWDADPWLLGTPDGTVDLRTGELRPARPDDYITKATAIVPAPPGTRAPLWCSTLETITGKDEELQAYLRRWFGYSLTGSIREHAFAFGYGTGANGKGVLLNTIKAILGDYAAVIPTEMLMVSQNERHPTELARLRGIRLAIGSETEQGKRWAESRIKSLTGGDPIAARYMRADFFEFQPQFKLFVVGNHRPALRGVDEAMRRRLHFIPFEITIPPEDRDPDLTEKLKREWPAILRWAIEGCIEWQHDGLKPPRAVHKATEEYFEDEDAFGTWLAECTEPNANAWASSKALFNSWKQWAEAAGEFVGTRKRFAHQLEERGLVEQRRHEGRGYLGAKLTEDATTASGTWHDQY